MYKKTVTYTDYFGKERTEDFYFNFTKAELMDLEMTTVPSGKLSDYLSLIVENKDLNTMLSLFKELVIKAYGVRSEDGRRFIKNDELRTEFMETEAYSEIFYELATNSDAAAAFVNGVVPSIDSKSVA